MVYDDIREHRLGSLLGLKSRDGIGQSVKEERIICIYAHSVVAIALFKYVFQQHGKELRRRIG